MSGVGWPVAKGFNVDWSAPVLSPNPVPLHALPRCSRAAEEQREELLRKNTLVLIQAHLEVRGPCYLPRPRIDPGPGTRSLTIGSIQPDENDVTEAADTPTRMPIPVDKPFSPIKDAIGGARQMPSAMLPPS